MIVLGPPVQVCPVDDWRCTLVEGGGLSVMMGLDRMKLILLVNNWDTPEPAVLMMCVYQGIGEDSP